MWEWVSSAATWAWFTEPFVGLNWWEILNAGFVGTAISSIVGIYVARSVGQVAKETEQATALRDAERAEGDARVILRDDPTAENVDDDATPAPMPQDLGANQSFATASASIRRLKDYVEAVADRCRDGRTRRKYANMSRRDYRILTAALGEDGGLKGAQLEKILGAFEEWRGYRNGRVAVPREVASRLQDLANRYRVTTTSPPRWKPERTASAEST